MGLYPITIIQDFYENPDAMRAFALGQEFTYCFQQENPSYGFPGTRTKDLFALDKKLFEQVCKKLVSVFHNTEHDLMRWAITTSFQLVTGDYGQGVIHTDTNTIFAGVLYLTPDAPLDSGTSLYRKNSSFNQLAYERALTLNDQKYQASEKIVPTDYHSMFDEVIRINNVYNTLILFEGDQYHAANQFFGTAPQNARLAQVFFVSKIDAQKQSVFPISRVQSIHL